MGIQIKITRWAKLEGQKTIKPTFVKKRTMLKFCKKKKLAKF